jgi:uncharacterized membrane protein YheB (UPF0754 family)
MTWWLFLIPVSTAFSCWAIFKILLTVLFRPYKIRSIAGLKFQGLLPAKQTEIAGRIGRLVAEQFFSMDLIKEKISDPGNFQKILPAIEEHIDDFLRNKLKKQMPVISVFIGEKTITTLKQVFVNELETLFPRVMNDYANNLAKDLNIEELVSQKLAAVSIKQVEIAIHQNFSKQLRFAEIASSLIGILIGLITMLIILSVK